MAGARNININVHTTAVANRYEFMRLLVTGGPTSSGCWAPVPDPYFPFAADVAPICQIGMSDIQQAEPDSWLDVSCYVHTCEVFRGRDRFTDRFQPGTCSITFSNSNGWADLAGDGFDVAAAPCRPGRPLRIGVRGPWDTDGVITTRWLWRGWIDQCTPLRPTEHDVVDVNGIESLEEAGTSTIDRRVPRRQRDNVGRIHRILDAADWPSSKRRVDGSTTTVQGTSFVDRDRSDGVTADSEGGWCTATVRRDVVLATGTGCCTTRRSARWHYRQRRPGTPDEGPPRMSDQGAGVERRSPPIRDNG